VCEQLAQRHYMLVELPRVRLHHAIMSHNMQPTSSDVHLTPPRESKYNYSNSASYMIILMMTDKSSNLGHSGLVFWFSIRVYQ